MNAWNLYIARCKDNTLYIGISNNVTERIKQHNKGQGAQWIKQHGQAEIIYTEKYENYIDAHNRELQIKKWSRIKKENLIKYKHPTKIKN